MIEALAHDLGKATPQRFSGGGNHAKAGAEMLEAAGFGDEGVLMLIRRHHQKIKPQPHARKQPDEKEGVKRDLRLLQLADRSASQQRSEGGTSKSSLIPEMGHQHLKLTEAYLQFGLKRHFQQHGADYTAFKQFIQNNWWLEVVRASTTDAENESLRHHLLLTDVIYQQLLLRTQIRRITEIEVDLGYWEIPIQKIDGRPKDINLRLRIVDLLATKQLHPYAVWKELDASGIHKDRRFVARLLEEMEMVSILGKGDGKYKLKKGFAPKQKANKPQIIQITQRNSLKEKRVIEEMHLAGFEVDAIALEVGLLEKEVREVVIAI